jgi:ketosteroid isomerase-like protein
MSMKLSKRWGWIKSATVKIEIFACTALVCCAFCSCKQGYDQKEAERYIRESESQWAESVASGDGSVVQRILADDFIGVDPKGGHYDKTKMIAETSDGAKYFASNHLNDVKIRFYGDTALAQGNESWERKSGERGRFVWTDTWLRRNGQWQIVAAEDLIAPEATPAPQP